MGGPILPPARSLESEVVLAAGLNVVADPVTAWWKYGERALGVKGWSSGTSVRVPTRGESMRVRGWSSGIGMCRRWGR